MLVMFFFVRVTKWGISSVSSYDIGLNEGSVDGRLPFFHINIEKNVLKTYFFLF